MKKILRRGISELNFQISELQEIIVIADLNLYESIYQVKTQKIVLLQ